MTMSASRTNGFLFADLRDYTSYVESQGDRAAVVLLDLYRALVRAAVAEFGGAEIKTEGDSFYVVFPSASTAVQCGLAILAAAAEKSVDGIPIRVGIGVHAGETVETSEGYVGSAVNMAARVCSQARAGELLVTDTVRALVRTMLPVRFTDRRMRRLKGIAEPVVLYRAEALPAGVESAGTPPRRRIIGRLATPSGIPRTTRVIVLLVGLLIGGAASGYLLNAAQRPSGGPGATPAGSGPVGGTFPTAEEADLLGQVPSEIRDTCGRASDEDALMGAISSLRCDLELAAEADTVWYDRFATSQGLSDALALVMQRENLQRGDCGPQVPRAQGNWQVGSTHSGRLLCYETDGRTWITWSYDAERIVARAVRGGATPDDWLGLYEWWGQIRLFLRGA